MKSSAFVRVLFGFLILMVLAGCAQKTNIDACVQGDPYGFFGGLLHGIIAPIELIAMLFKDDVVVFATNNNGFWYSFGFLLGSGGWGILAGKSKK
jgi:hypothetical protein